MIHNYYVKIINLDTSSWNQKLKSFKFLFFSIPGRIIYNLFEKKNKHNYFLFLNNNFCSEFEISSYSV